MSPARTSRISRIGWILAVALILAASVLWMLRGRGPAVDYSLGGSLFGVSAEEIDGLLLTRGGAQYRIDRSESGEWVLTGAMTDFLNRTGVEKLLNGLANATGGPLLPGTEPEDRRYEFYGAGSIRLTVFAGSREPVTLVLGATNPVTGLVYASGAGRSACFPVPAKFRDSLAELPDAIRTKTLLPELSFQSVNGIEIQGRGSATRLQRLQQKWWLRTPDSDHASLGAVVADYQALYPDRRLDQVDGIWILADADAVNALLYEISSPVVRRFVPAAEAAANSGNWSLEPFYRRVILDGEGLNPDPRFGESDRLVVDFGPSLDGQVAPARRLDNVLLADETALRSLELPVADLVSRRALAFPVILADSIRFHFQGEPILSGHRDADLFADILAIKHGDLDRVEGRRAWLRDFPVPTPETPGGPVSHVRLRTLVVEMERIPILAVLPPARGEAPFRSDGRCRVEIAGSGDSEIQTVELGWLDPALLPAGAEVVSVDGEREPAGLWLPQSGQLLQVPSQILITIRNLRELR